ncbi:MAG TPA: sigma-70 family RNA polymerase sigma factor [Planctomycetota bacterium]|nr:sigma-70 family RNA polymerase sigma factor [Planctomycetota bacterium]
MPSDPGVFTPEGDDSFNTTRWSLVLQAGAGGASGSPEARRALSELCSIYWYPLYAFVRRNGFNHDDAEDLTQTFFAQLFERSLVGAAQREKGRFRAYLLSSMKNFLSDERSKARALKRGGGRIPLSLDMRDAENRYLCEPASHETPEQLYERRWAVQLLDRALHQLERESDEAGRGELFGKLKECLTGGRAHADYARIAGEINSTEGAIKVAAHRLRQRYKEVIRELVAETVEHPEDIQDELSVLFEAFAR